MYCETQMYDVQEFSAGDLPVAPDGKGTAPGKELDMKYLPIIILALILSSGCATTKTDRSWSNHDKALAVACCTATVADAYTTMRALDVPGNYENNPILGGHPSDTEVVAYMAASQLVILAIAHAFPQLRKYLLGGVTTMNSVCAVRNSKLY